MTWQEFLQNCKIAWETEGNSPINKVKIVHSYLLKVPKKTNQTLMKVASQAYKLYKKDKQGNT